MNRRDAEDIADALERDAYVVEFKLKQDGNQNNEFLGIYLVENPLRRTIRGDEVEIHIHWGDVGVVHAANMRWPGQMASQSVQIRLGRNTIHACEAALGNMRENRYL